MVWVAIYGLRGSPFFVPSVVLFYAHAPSATSWHVVVKYHPFCTFLLEKFRGHRPLRAHLEIERGEDQVQKRLSLSTTGAGNLI